MLASDRGTQPALLPTDARDLLPADHMAWEILAVVDEFDLSHFHAAYRADGRGRPPYDPATMIALIHYCASKNIRGSRRIEAACVDDLGARVITGNNRPDHTTINRFLTDHGPALRGLLPQSLRLCDDDGLIDLSVIAGDGTKVQANAAMAATVDESTLRGQITELREQIADVEAQWQTAITTDTPALFDLDPPAPTTIDDATSAPTGGAASSVTPALTSERAWRGLTILNQLLHARLHALDRLLTRPNTERSDWEAKRERDQARVARCQQRLHTTRTAAQTAHEDYRKAETAGRKPRGRCPLPPDQHSQVRQAEQALATAVARADKTTANPPTVKVNTTDPDSRIMPAKHGGYDQLFNLQAAATQGRQIILGVTVHDSPNDKQALTGLLTASRTNLDTAGITRAIGVALFDSGYASKANFTADLPVERLLVAVEREARQTGRLDDDTSTAADTWHDMATLMADPVNHTLYAHRGAIIEPVFAQLFNHFGHNLHLRGADHVTTELHVWATSHNLGKLIRHRRRTRKTGPPG
jgi:transposase